MQISPPSPPYDLEDEICPIMLECLIPPTNEVLCQARLSRPEVVKTTGLPDLTLYRSHDKIRCYGYLMNLLKEFYPAIVLRDVQLLTTLKTRRSSSLIFKSWCPFHQRVHHQQHWFCTTYRDTEKTFIGCFHTRGGKFIRRVDGFSVWDDDWKLIG